MDVTIARLIQDFDRIKGNYLSCSDKTESELYINNRHNMSVYCLKGDMKQ